MGVKVYFVYDGEGPESVPIESSRLNREAYKAKITIPDGWMAGPCEKLRSFFCGTYNKKYPQAALVDAEMSLQVGDITLPLDGLVSQYVQEHNDILVKHVVKVVTTGPAEEGTLLCGNFGCGKRFKPEENNDTACHSHAKGPVFHDTYKYWGCCPDQKAFDFSDFQAIAKCVVGRHAVAERPVTFTSPNANVITNQALSQDQVASMAVPGGANVLAAPTYEGPARNGPREFDGANQGQGEVAADGTGKCRNPGCQKRFVVAENTAESCVYHSMGPVFWDTYKYWKCCPDKKHIEFDDFAKVEGCTRGPHKL